MMLFIYETLGCNIYGKCVEKAERAIYFSIYLPPFV